MPSTRTCDKPFATLSPNARKEHVIPSLKSGALLCLGQLCDDGCIICLYKLTITFHKHNTIIQGKRDIITVVWIVNIPHSPLYHTIFFSILPLTELVCHLPVLVTHRFGLSPNTRKDHIIPLLKSGAILPLGQLCDDGCIIY